MTFNKRRQQPPLRGLDAKTYTSLKFCRRCGERWAAKGIASMAGEKGAHRGSRTPLLSSASDVSIPLRYGSP